MDNLKTSSIGSSKDVRNHLRSFLIEMGFNEKIADKQINQLFEVIYLSALRRLALIKKIDMSAANELDPEAKKRFLEESFTFEEIADALAKESQTHIKKYLEAIDGKGKKTI